MKIQANLGWMGPDPEEVVITNRAAATVAVGACLMLDRRRADADSTNNKVGSENAGIANGITPGAATTDQMVTEIFGIVQVGAADNVRTRLRIRGAVDAVILSAGDAVVLATTRCVVTAGFRTISASNATQENSGTAAALTRKVVFLPLTAVAASGTTDGLFDGVHGFGTILLTSAP